jgi:fructoselysine-6-P-deglycase FrlB-like protein
MEIEELIENCKQSLLFTSPILGVDLQRFLEQEGGRIRLLAQTALDRQVKHIYWIGSGNSWLNLLSGKYLLDKFTEIPSDCYPSYEFIWRHPMRLKSNSWTFLASFSGATEDTVNALRFAKQQGSHTIAIVNKEDSLMGREADEAVAYHSKALYILPLAAVYLFALELARLSGVQEAQQVIDGLHAVPELLSRQYVDEEARARRLAEEFANENLFYVLASGPLYGLGYKFGLTVFMENMRVHGSFMDASEFRHGPAEMLDRNQPAMVILKGTDESRPVVERVCEIALKLKAKLIVYDSKSYPGFHPLLAPFVLMIPLQWFAVYSSVLRGITDLDQRALMGKGLLGKGKEITWP